jgi:hypothetical protein
MRDSSSTEQPDWLQRLAGNSAVADQTAKQDQADEEQVSPAVSSTSAGMLDRLKNFASTPSAEPPARSIEPPAASQSAAESDWLSNLRAATPVDSSIEEPIESDEMPAWANDLSASAPMSSEPAASDTPDWLNNLRAAPVEPETLPSEEPPAELGSSSAEMPEWLSQLATSSAETSTGTSPSEETNTSETPDWLRDLSGAPASSPEPSTTPPAESEMPDWLRDLSGAPSPSPAPVDEPPAPTEMPDWLRDLSGTPATSQPPADTQPVAESDVPDWLSNLSGAASGAESLAAPEPANDVPDWLRGDRSTQSMPPAAPTSASIEEPATVLPPAEPASEIPDWLASLQTTAPAPIEPPAKPSRKLNEPARSAPIEPLTKPSSKIDQSAKKIEPLAKPIEPPAKPSRKIEPAAPAVKPASGLQATPSNELPTWLQGLNQPAADTRPRGPSAPIPPELPPELRAEPADADALPDWLQSLRKDSPNAAAAGSGLAQGEIPDWLQALKPSEDTSDFAGEIPETEGEGVLAGIANALPSISIISEVQGLPAKLKVETSAQDLARAGMLQELLARGAAAPKPVMVVPGAGARMRRRVGQLLMALIILLAIGLPAWIDLNKTLGFNLLPRIDKLSSNAISPAFNTIDQLPDGSSALVIFDYDPTQAGEMNPIADVLLRHLIARGVDVNVASLNPLGSSLAQAMWLKASGQISDSVQFKNLGYVAGQSIGVQQLLASNSTVNVVIDLAASSDSLRWWVEQIAATGSSVPLVAGLSAGAEPLVLPYVRSGQVKGMVAGVVDALIYEQHAGLSPLSTSEQATENQIHLEAQTLAQWVMVLIILIGLLSALFSRGGRRSTV